MAEEIKDLIAQIQKEGVQAAEEQAGKIKLEAQALAQDLIDKAKEQAKNILTQANLEAKNINTATQILLKQAGRDLIISLREEINALLQRIIKADVNQLLAPEELARIIGSLVANAPLSLGSEIVVSLNAADKEKLAQGFLKQLIQQTKREIVLKSTQEIERGFIISFDAGKSIFDFSAQSLTEYIAQSIKPELAKFLVTE